MSKKPQEQKPDIGNTAVDRVKPARIAKSRQVLLTSGAGRRNGVPEPKSHRVLALLKRVDGATLDELMKATKWQANSVRGFLSGAVKKKMGLTLLSACDEAGIRRYRVTEAEGA